MILGIILLVAPFFKAYSYYLLIFSIIKLTGLLLSTSLIINELHKENSFLSKLCNVVKSDCETVIEKGGKFMGIFEWSELSFGYFLGSIVILILHSNETLYDNIMLLYFFKTLNYFTLVFSLYSIFYQMFIAKKWCAICLSFLILFWFEFFVLYLINPSNKNINEFIFLDLIRLLTFFGLPFLLFLYISPLIKDISKYIYKNRLMNKIKYDLRVFNLLKDRDTDKNI